MTTPTSTTWPVLTDAHHALRTVVQGLTTAAADRPTPCENWTVTQVLQHAAGDQRAYAVTLTGQDGPTDDPFAPSGELTESPTEYLEPALRAAAEAFAAVTPDATAVPTPLPQGGLPAEVAVGACALDAAVHAWDIAMATGQPSPLTPSLAATLHPIALQLVEPLRAYGAYAAIVEPDPSDDAVAALLRYLGRNPHWTK